ncbi:MAG: hypothetical protein K0S74_1719 [Chlamydiales bacterium]|jgi:hypothetical protein|nr:hypothetical protein [Chlamydiales bacterium]
MKDKTIPRSNADDFCQKIMPQEKPMYIGDSLVKGLTLRVMPTGSKTWIFRYHMKDGNEWRSRKTGLGPFRQGRNDVVGLTVNAARIEAERIRKEVKHEGADPIADREQKAAERSIKKAQMLTVRELFERWANTDLINRKDGGAEAKRMMEKDVLPFIEKWVGCATSS